MLGLQNSGPNQEWDMAKFQKGQSGNPSGKPKGTRNKITVLFERLLDENAQPLIEKAIELAKAGDVPSLRLLIDRIAPARKDRHVEFNLPEMTCAADAVKAAAALAKAVAGGELTPSEAADLGKLVESYARALQGAEFEERLSKLEKAIAK
jgi:Family of unknown function (DUF5681)